MDDAERKDMADCDEDGPCAECEDKFCPWHPSSDEEVMDRCPTA